MRVYARSHTNRHSYMITHAYMYIQESVHTQGSYIPILHAGKFVNAHSFTHTYAPYTHKKMCIRALAHTVHRTIKMWMLIYAHKFAHWSQMKVGSGRQMTQHAHAWVHKRVCALVYVSVPTVVPDIFYNLCKMYKFLVVSMVIVDIRTHALRFLCYLKPEHTSTMLAHTC